MTVTQLIAELQRFEAEGMGRRPVYLDGVAWRDEIATAEAVDNIAETCILLTAHDGP